MPTTKWPTWKQVHDAYFRELYQAAPNFGEAAKAAGVNPDTVADNVDKAGIPRKKSKRKGEMAPPPEELVRLVEQPKC